SYTLVLDSRPELNVSITATPDGQIDLGAGVGIPISLIFTPINWNLPQTVLVSAFDDEIAEDEHNGLISHSIATSDSNYASISIPNVGVAITDDEMRELRINEIDSDNIGTDSLEFVEIYDGGIGNTSLNDIVVVFFNGNSDQPYASFDLDGFSTDIAGFFVLGNAAVPEVDLVFNNNTLQNGADAVGLYRGQASQITSVTSNNLIDAVVYDTSDADDQGLLPLLLSGGQINENGSGNASQVSLARIPDGGDPRSTLGFVTQVPTPGTFNVTAPEPGIQIAKKRFVEGQSTTFDFAFSVSPAADVELRVFPNTQLDLGEGPGIPISLAFTPQNALITQTLNVGIVDDSAIEGPHFGRLGYIIRSDDPAFDGLLVEGTNIAIEDNDFQSISSSIEAATEVTGQSSVSESMVESTVERSVVETPTEPITTQLSEKAQTQEMPNLANDDPQSPPTTTSTVDTIMSNLSEELPGEETDEVAFNPDVHQFQRSQYPSAIAIVDANDSEEEKSHLHSLNLVGTNRIRSGTKPSKIREESEIASDEYFEDEIEASEAEEDLLSIDLIQLEELFKSL
ncbi:MAG: hypothetical protein AAF664_18050, partial [Planctomycetota bacterium]